MNNNYTALDFAPAANEHAFARVAIVGPSGSGKTWTSLAIATAMCENVAVIDTENGTASKYKKDFSFEAINLKDHSLGAYRHCINRAQERGFDGLIIDSLSHAWSGRGGALEMADNAAARYKGNTWAAWRDVTPEHNLLVDTLIYANLHLFVTMRAKTEWHVEKDDNGKVRPVKVGLAPVQRAGLEYEFDVVADMDTNHTFIVTKTRCSALDNAVIKKPEGKVLAAQISAWLDDEDDTDTDSSADDEGPSDYPYLNGTHPETVATPDAPEATGSPASAVTDAPSPLNRNQLLAQVQQRGEAIYGTKWPDVRRRNVSRLTENDADTLSKLKSDQLSILLTGLEQLAARTTA